MISIRGVNGRTYFFSVDAFGRRVMNLANRRGWTSLSDAQAELSALPFNAAGWRILKQMVAELVLGSIALPDDVASGWLKAAVTEADIADRDVGGGVT